MRILVFNWKDSRNPEAGGSEAFLESVGREWIRAGHTVTLFCRSFPGAAPLDEVDGLQIVRRGNKLSVYAHARRWYRRVARGRYDAVLEVVNTRPFMAPRFVRDVPVSALVYQLAADVWDYEVPAPLAMFGRRVLEPRWLRRYADVPTLTISESSRSDLVRMGLRDVTVVPMSFDRPSLDRIPPKAERPTVAFVGRLVANKRPRDVIAAFAIVRRRVPDAQLWIVGSGPERDRLLTQRVDGVTFLGRVDAVEKYRRMASAHVLAVTSVREGWGLVVSEAASVGTSSVGYDVPGLRDSIAAAGGMLVPSGDINALADALTRVLRAGPDAAPSADLASWGETARACLRVVARTRARAEVTEAGGADPFRAG